MVTYIPITKVEGFTKLDFPPVPSLEPNLTAFFGLKVANTTVGRHPSW